MDIVEQHRRFYAELIVRGTGSTDQRLIDAFASVPREDYVGPGPWNVHAGFGYISTPSADPSLLYQDVLIALDVRRKINNGQPSLHARCLKAAAPAPGETVIHVGAGTGYYTAVLANLVGPAGRVTAFEIEADIAACARSNLAHLPHVTVRQASATQAPIPQCDLIYVNAGATHPPAAWLDALKIGGRLVFPLTPNEGFGVMLKIKRLGEISYSAAALMRVAFIPCIGARSEAASASLAAALERPALPAVRSLRRGTVPDATAWCAGDGWWLSTEDAR